MSIPDEILLAERRIRAAGFSLSGWLSEKGIDRASWYRWRNGGNFGVHQWAEVQALIAQLPTIVPAGNREDAA